MQHNTTKSRYWGYALFLLVAMCVGAALRYIAADNASNAWFLGVLFGAGTCGLFTMYGLAHDDA